MTNLVDTFLNQLTAEEKRSKTREQYGGNLRRFERWLQETHSLLLTKEQIGVVTGLMLTEFYQHLHAQGLKASTRNAYVIALIVYQLGLLFSGAGFGVGTVVAFVLLAGLVYLLVRKNPYDSNHLSQNVKVNA